MSLPKVLVTEKLSNAALDLFKNKAKVIEIDGTNREELKNEILNANAVIIRSATFIDSEILEYAKNLKIIARAGVGLDNVDIETATKMGVMVVNAPTSNIHSAAEQAMALILATARNTALADISLKNKKWERNKLSGIELFGKTAGIIGLGKIGQLVASRLKAFGMEIIAYDPYISVPLAKQLGVELMPIDELIQKSDIISIHLPKTDETKNILNKERINLLKPKAIIVNASRGGLIDEEELAKAILEKKIFGAGLDVFAKEPPFENPLLELDKVTVTPHLGASTAEAQEKAGTAVVKSVLAAFAGEFVPDAVNIPGGPVGEEVSEWLSLVKKIGKMLANLTVFQASNLTLEVIGELASLDVSVLEIGLLQGYLQTFTSDSVTFVNVEQIAKSRNLHVKVVKESESYSFRSLIKARAIDVNGEEVSIGGTLNGKNKVEKFVSLNGKYIDTLASGLNLILIYPDRVGVISKVGTILAEEEMDIFSAIITPENTNNAIMIMQISSIPEKKVIEKISSKIEASKTFLIDLRD